MTNVRVRIGVRLPWPAKNWAVAVVYVSEEGFEDLLSSVARIKRLVPGTWTDRLFVERG